MKILNNDHALLKVNKGDRIQMCQRVSLWDMTTHTYIFTGKIRFVGRVYIVRDVAHCDPTYCEKKIKESCLTDGLRIVVGPGDAICAGGEKSTWTYATVPIGGLHRFGAFDPKNPPFEIVNNRAVPKVLGDQNEGT
jgi:hypothetical protein